LGIEEGRSENEQAIKGTKKYVYEADVEKSFTQHLFLYDILAV
jgi:hypothetical protein